MRFFVTDTFQKALGKLDNNSQKAAKNCAFDLQMNPTGKGKQFHRIDNSKEKNFWSVRANRDVRIIVHKTDDRFTLCYVDHHDDAYKWAERRVFEEHPTTGALQVVQLVERVQEDLADDAYVAKDLFDSPATQPGLPGATREQLLEYGVPDQWVEPLLKADEERVYLLTDHLPEEASEAVLGLLLGEVPVPTKALPNGQNPDEFRRFRMVEHIEELEQALDFPMDRWAVFLHPSQRQYVDADYAGPARVCGSAGTGKTVVALHRAVRMAQKPNARVLLTTFSEPLAALLDQKVRVLNGDTNVLVPNIHVSSFLSAAAELYELNIGRKPVLVAEEKVVQIISEIAPDEDLAFLISEWREVVDDWQVDSLEDYLELKRTGRRSRVVKKERERIWPIFETTRSRIAKIGRMTEAQVFAECEKIYLHKDEKPYSHIIVDEAQDLGVSQLRFLSAVVSNENDSLFFAGDLGQRIFKLPFSWAKLGVNIEGRSGTLHVNYRMSHQVREASDKLLPDEITDMDGSTVIRSGTVSVFNGPVPELIESESEEEEIDQVSDWIDARLSDGIPKTDIGLIVRSDRILSRARRVASKLGIKFQTLTESMTLRTEALPIGTMHLAKGLEFRCVAIVGCDDSVLPLQERLETVVTEHDLDEVYATERHLLYVACTRAREHLLISGVKPVSDYFADLR